MPLLNCEQARLVRDCLAGLRAAVHNLAELPARRHNADGLPLAIDRLWRDCEAIEHRIKAGISQGGMILIDEQEIALVSLSVSESFRYLVTILERSQPPVFDPNAALLKLYAGLMSEPWFRNQPVSGRPTLPPARQLDEKFGILQAPPLLQRDLAYYRTTCESTGSPLALAYIDIDYFKQFNTEYGETVVDRAVLPRFMRLIARFALDRGGQGYRLGGDEFGILLPGSSLRDAAEALDGLRQEVGALRFGDDIMRAATVSIGICAAEPPSNVTGLEMEQQAERAKNAAKQDGRNRMAVSERAGDCFAIRVIAPGATGL
jgi:diguanylate cyclase (GGDEF)-like protein